MDETAVALGRPFRWSGEVEGAEKFALFGGFAAEFFAGFGFAVESLSDGCGAALVANEENLDLELAGFVFDVEHVADADFAGGFGGDVVRGDAVHVAGFGGLLAGFEEAGGPEPLVDARAGHAFYFLTPLALYGAKDAHREIEERADEFEGAADYETDEAEGEQDQPDERVEDYRDNGGRPADDEKDQEEKQFHVWCSLRSEIRARRMIGSRRSGGGGVYTPPPLYQAKRLILS